MGEYYHHGVPWRWWEVLPVYLGSGAVLLVIAMAFTMAEGATLDYLFPLDSILLGAIAVLWVSWRYPGHAMYLWIRGRPRRHFLGAFVGVAFGASLALLAALVIPSYHWSFPIELGSASGHSNAILIDVLLLAPLAEELVFRGLLFQALVDRMNLTRAAAISGLAFGLVHLSLDAWALLHVLVVVVPLGAVAALLFHFTNSLLPAVALHMAATASAIVPGMGPS